MDYEAVKKAYLKVKKHIDNLKISLLEVKKKV